MIRLAKAGLLAREPKFRQIGSLTREIKDIAFSGEGEPTIIRNFSECVRAVVAVRSAENLTRTKLVLITNAAGLNKADVKRGLVTMDANGGEIWGKLDAGTESYFRAINRSSVRFERILKNLLETAQARPIVVQSLFVRIHGQAMAEEELAAYCKRLCEMIGQGAQIQEVHAYTIARRTPEPYVTRLPRAQLEKMAEKIRDCTGLPVLTFE
jgi:wyosine [tRNA(Phe)-imidazoG37] synthetase (radical SAM superfamily)